MKTSRIREVLGFLIAPAMPAATLCVGQVVAFGDLGEGLLFYAAAALIIGYLSMTLLGIPAYLMLTAKNSLNLKNCLAVGGAIGLAWYAIYLVPLYFTAESSVRWELFRNTVGFGGFGLIGGLLASFTFWLIRGPQPSLHEK